METETRDVQIGLRWFECGLTDKDPFFVKTWDDDFDSTYGYYEFSVPEKWKSDFDKILQMNYESVSDEFVNCVKSFYPKLAESGTIDKIFKREVQNEAD